MTKLRILSDLHLEVEPWTYRPCGEDLVILAGDICDHSRLGLHRRNVLFSQIGRAKLKALYVIGNHEGYHAGTSYGGLTERISAGLPEHVALLHPGVIVERLGLRFIGCTLWTDFQWLADARWRGLVMTTDDARYVARHCVTDFLALSPDGAERQLQADDLIAWHRADRAWLTDAITTSDPTVVVTHFLPGPASIAEQFLRDPVTPYFVSDCRDLMRAPVRLWVHGHTHTSCRYRHGEVEVVCNPRGYGDENAQFQNDLVVEVALPEAPARAPARRSKE